MHPPQHFSECSTSAAIVSLSSGGAVQHLDAICVEQIKIYTYGCPDDALHILRESYKNAACCIATDKMHVLFLMQSLSNEHAWVQGLHLQH